MALARLGYRVGLADADVYGPSVPKMTGTEGACPEAFSEGEKEVIFPVEKYGVKWMSIGYFAAPDQALIWRGPMACNALRQMILQVRWGELDFLLIDMPPGTGDIHISLVHDIPMEGAVIVSTPQAVALADVEKGVNMFRNESINKPIFGLVENMAWFTPEELPENRYYIFGRDGGARMAEKYGSKPQSWKWSPRPTPSREKKSRTMAWPSSPRSPVTMRSKSFGFVPVSRKKAAKVS